VTLRVQNGALVGRTWGVGWLTICIGETYGRSGDQGISLPTTEPEGSWPCSHKPANDPYPGLDESNRLIHSMSIITTSLLVICTSTYFLMNALRHVFRSIFLCISHLLIFMCLSYLSLLQLITLITCDSSFCNLLHPPVISSPTRPNILTNTTFHNPFSVFSGIGARSQD
jgi:hypothetical protein